MGNTISRKTWDEAKDEGTKLNLLFDLLCDTNERVKALENRKRIDSVYSLGGGLIGGACTVAAKLAFWKS